MVKVQQHAPLVLLSRNQPYQHHGYRFTRRRMSMLDETQQVVNEEKMKKQEQEQEQEEFTTAGTDTDAIDPFLERFHADMRQVLQSRRSLLEPLLEESRNRQRRPVVLDEDVDGAQRVYTMLQHLIQTKKATFESFEIVLEALVRRDRMRWQINNHNHNNHNHKKDTSDTTYMCAADQAEQLFQQLVETVLPNIRMQQPKVVIPVSTYSLVLQTYANCATPRGNKHYADRAMRLYQRLVEAEHHGGNGSGGEHPHLLAHVVHAYAWEQANLKATTTMATPPAVETTEEEDADEDDDGPQQQQQQQQQVELQEQEHERSAAQQAQRLLDERIESNVDNLTTLMQCYDWVLEAWSKSGSPGSAENANVLFEKMKALNETIIYTSSPTSSSTSPPAAPPLQRVLDAETYSNIILAWSKSSSPGSTERAHELLLELIDKYRAGAFKGDSSSSTSTSTTSTSTTTSCTEPALIAFNGVITAWGRAGRPDQAEQVLQRMQDLRPYCRNLVPDAITYNSVMYAYLRSSHLPPAQVPDKVSELLKYMHDNSMIQPALTPNCFTYTMLLKSWIQSGRPDMAEEAEAVLQEIERAWSNGDRSVEPNNRVFNMVINAYAKGSSSSSSSSSSSGSSSMSSSSSRSRIQNNQQEPRYTLSTATAAARALNLLKRMKESPLKQCHPDNISYTCVLECLSKSADLQAPLHAQALLNELSELYEKTRDPALMPNARTFTMAILTFAKNHGSVEEARNLLTRLVDWYERTKDPQLRPNEYAYNYVLNCAANSPLPASSLTSSLLSSPDDDDNDDDDASKYASAAPDYKNIRPRALTVATQTYQEMRKSSLVKPDSYTYAFWIKCCNNLIPKGELRSKCISYAFEECRKNGLVTNEVLTRLFQGSPPHVVDPLLGFSSSSSSTTRTAGSVNNKNKNNKVSGTVNYRTVTVNGLPPSWSRNAPQRKKR